MAMLSDRKVTNSDSKGRVTLGAAHANKTFRILSDPAGNLVLEPVVAVHEREAWLYRNPDALASVRRGIEQSKRGKGKYLGPFAEFADLEVGD